MPLSWGTLVLWSGCGKKVSTSSTTRGFPAGAMEPPRSGVMKLDTGWKKTEGWSRSHNRQDGRLLDLLLRPEAFEDLDPGLRFFS